MNADIGLLALVWGPAVIAVFALFAAIAFGVAARRATPNSRLGHYIGLGVCALVFLGIGTCYASIYLAR